MTNKINLKLIVGIIYFLSAFVLTIYVKSDKVIKIDNFKNIETSHYDDGEVLMKIYKLNNDKISIINSYTNEKNKSIKIYYKNDKLKIRREYYKNKLSLKIRYKDWKIVSITKYKNNKIIKRLNNKEIKEYIKKSKEQEQNEEC